MTGSQIGEFKLEVTLCSHYTINFPNNSFFHVVLSLLSIPVFGLWEDFPCQPFAVACLLVTCFLFAAGRGDIPPLFLQRWRKPFAIMLHTPSANSCKISSGLTCPRQKMQFCPKVHCPRTEFQQIVLRPCGVMYFGII
jgi:hypothetical protein